MTMMSCSLAVAIAYLIFEKASMRHRCGVFLLMSAYSEEATRVAVVGHREHETLPCRLPLPSLGKPGTGQRVERPAAGKAPVSLPAVVGPAPAEVRRTAERAGRAHHVTTKR